MSPAALASLETRNGLGYWITLAVLIGLLLLMQFRIRRRKRGPW